MNCSDVDRILPEIIDSKARDGAPINDLDFEFQAHLRNCLHCSELVSDLKLIASEARQLSDAEEPSPNVWLRIAAELRSEGLIREPEPVSRPVMVRAQRGRWKAFWLAPVAIAILAAGSYFLTHRTTPPAMQKSAKSVDPEPQIQVAEQPAAPPTSTPAAQKSTTPSRNQTPHVRALQAPPDDSEQAKLSAPPATDDQRFLSEVSSRAPTMRATYENELRAVNREIQETREYLRRYPEDMDARQHLLEVYQQKAMLYQIALDRIQ